MTTNITPKTGTLTKKELVTKTAETAGITQQAALTAVESVLGTISSSLVAGRRVELRGFGSFNVQTNKARIGRNPKNPTVDIAIPERTVVKFKVSKNWKVGKVH